MKLVLEINQNQDWEMLLLLFQRLKIPYFIQKEEQKAAILEPSAKKNGVVSPSKNFDAEAINRLLDEIGQRNLFAGISDPVAWQKQLRDEWE